MFLWEFLKRFVRKNYGFFLACRCLKPTIMFEGVFEFIESFVKKGDLFEGCFNCFFEEKHGKLFALIS